MAQFNATQGVAQQLLQSLLFGNPDFNLNQAIDQQGQQQDLQSQRVLNAFGKQGLPIRRRDLRGNVIDDVNPSPSGLDGFFANNPNVRSGEFDPTGAQALARGAQQGAVADTNVQTDETMAQARLAFAQNLANQLQGTAPEFGPPREASTGNQNPAAGGGQNDEVAALRDQVSRMGGILEALSGSVGQGQPGQQTGAAPAVPSVQQTAPQPGPPAADVPGIDPGIDVRTAFNTPGPPLAGIAAQLAGAQPPSTGFTAPVGAIFPQDTGGGGDFGGFLPTIPVLPNPQRPHVNISPRKQSEALGLLMGAPNLFTALTRGGAERRRLNQEFAGTNFPRF